MPIMPSSSFFMPSHWISASIHARLSGLPVWLVKSPLPRQNPRLVDQKRLVVVRLTPQMGGMLMLL
jgi:hypothetical protein